MLLSYRHRQSVNNRCFLLTPTQCHFQTHELVPKVIYILLFYWNRYIPVPSPDSVKQSKKEKELCTVRGSNAHPRHDRCHYATASLLNHAPCGYCEVYAAVGKTLRETSPVSRDFHLATSVGVNSHSDNERVTQNGGWSKIKHPSAKASWSKCLLQSESDHGHWRCARANSNINNMIRDEHSASRFLYWF